VTRARIFDTLASGRGLKSPVWKRALSNAPILKSPKLWKRLWSALVPPVITQLAVHRLVGTVEVPEVMIVPRLAGLPVPPVGEIAVVTMGAAASALGRLENENGMRLKSSRTTPRNEMRGPLTVTTLPLMMNLPQPCVIGGLIVLFIHVERNSYTRWQWIIHYHSALSRRRWLTKRSLLCLFPMVFSILPSN
jgi:hypothetical protein